MQDIALKRTLQQDSYSAFRFSQRGRAMISPATKSTASSTINKPRLYSLHDNQIFNVPTGLPTLPNRQDDSIYNRRKLSKGFTFNNKELLSSLN